MVSANARRSLVAKVCLLTLALAAACAAPKLPTPASLESYLPRFIGSTELLVTSFDPHDPANRLEDSALGDSLESALGRIPTEAAQAQAAGLMIVVLRMPAEAGATFEKTYMAHILESAQETGLTIRREDFGAASVRGMFWSVTDARTGVAGAAGTLARDGVRYFIESRSLDGVVEALAALPNPD